MNRPLSILMILHMPWSRNFGGSRVQLELAEEFRAMGHRVEKFDTIDAFSKNHSSPLTRLVTPSFATRAKKFVKANAHRFDIIDAHQGNLPFTKQELGFQGLLVTRSVGLYAFCKDFDKLERQKWGVKTCKTLIRRELQSLQQKLEREVPNYIRSFQTCDLINLPNSDELAYVRDNLGLGKKCAVFPFGLSLQRQEAFLKAASSPKIRLQTKQVVFIGTWSQRKGSRDWGEIIRQVRIKIPDAKFLFLGTGFSEDFILKDLNLPSSDWLQIVPSYNSEDLPGLLANATVGAFPSYMEGFGFAVLEKLACGIPTIAYDIPGPREMLRFLDPTLMAPVGFIEQFTTRLIEILQLLPETYADLSERCTQIAKGFSWREIAHDHLEVYQQFLQAVK